MPTKPTPPLTKLPASLLPPINTSMRITEAGGEKVRAKVLVHADDGTLLVETANKITLTAWPDGNNGWTSVAPANAGPKADLGAPPVLLEKAKAIRDANGKVTASMLQRELNVGYRTARSLIEELEAEQTAEERKQLAKPKGTADAHASRPRFVVVGRADGSGTGDEPAAAPTTLKALTIIQPFAHLIAIGEKLVENRTQRFSYRGPIAIHAGKSRTYNGDDVADLAKPYGIDPGALVFGAIIAVADLVDCLDVADIRAGKHDAEYPDLREHEHTEGPFCLVLRKVRRLAEPVTCSGAQGLWNVKGEVLAKVVGQLDGNPPDVTLTIPATDTCPTVTISGCGPTAHALAETAATSPAPQRRSTRAPIPLTIEVQARALHVANVAGRHDARYALAGVLVECVEGANGAPEVNAIATDARRIMRATHPASMFDVAGGMGSVWVPRAIALNAARIAMERPQDPRGAARATLTRTADDCTLSCHTADGLVTFGPWKVDPALQPPPYDDIVFPIQRGADLGTTGVLIEGIPLRKVAGNQARVYLQPSAGPNQPTVVWASGDHGINVQAIVLPEKREDWEKEPKPAETPTSAVPDAPGQTLMEAAAPAAESSRASTPDHWQVEADQYGSGWYFKIRTRRDGPAVKVHAYARVLTHAFDEESPAPWTNTRDAIEAAADRIQTFVSELGPQLDPTGQTVALVLVRRLDHYCESLRKAGGPPNASGAPARRAG